MMKTTMSSIVAVLVVAGAGTGTSSVGALDVQPAATRTQHRTTAACRAGPPIPRLCYAAAAASTRETASAAWRPAREAPIVLADGP